MWTYSQSKGHLSHNGALIATGYAGHGQGKNNPAMQDVHMIGPLPRGLYTIGAMRATTAHGPDALPLAPAGTNEMFGRGGFWIHGDSLKHPGEGSEGCICIDHATRMLVAKSADCFLEVVE